MIAQPDSQTQLLVSWLCPEPLGTHDVALLRYNLLYHEGTTFDAGRAMTISDLPPLLLSGEESESCTIEAFVSNVMAGTDYVVKVVGVVPGETGETADEFAAARTYGTGIVSHTT